MSDMTEEQLDDDIDDNIVVKLSRPLKRSDDKEIYEITVSEPNAAELSKAGGRTALFQMDDAAHAKLLSRITQPQITPNMYNQLKVSDSQKLMNAVITFLAGSSKADVFGD